jgi:hypothetical protein
MLGLSASATAALLKRFKIVGLTRPLKDEQLRNLFGPGRGLAKRKVGLEWYLALLNPGDEAPSEIPSPLFLSNKARRSDASSTASTSSSLTPSRRDERLSTSGGFSRRKMPRPPGLEAAVASDESSTDEEVPYCAECSFSEARLQQLTVELGRAQATAESQATAATA